MTLPFPLDREIRNLNEFFSLPRTGIGVVILFVYCYVPEGEGGLCSLSVAIVPLFTVS
jgi:hypothetical protein